MERDQPSGGIATRSANAAQILKNRTRTNMDERGYKISSAFVCVPFSLSVNQYLSLLLTFSALEGA
jgi:hypothetical protein